jgi:hypothetical protein
MSKTDREIAMMLNSDSFEVPKEIVSDFRLAASRLLSKHVRLMEVLDFLNSIEGDGYGGMASFEVARSIIVDLAAPNPVSSEYETVLNSWAECRELLSESRRSEEKIKSLAKRAFEFLQDKTFRPESDNKLCDDLVNDLTGAFAKGDGID